jgi:hypothetical protein
MQITQPNSGAPLNVAIMPWKHITTSNAAIVATSVITSELFTSVHVKKITVEISSEEVLSKNLPDLLETEFNRFDAMTDENGIIRAGQVVSLNDVLVGKVRKTEEISTPEEQLFATVFGKKYTVDDRSVRMSFKDGARVLRVARKGSTIFIYLAITRTLTIGDVLHDTKGNEIVIADIVPDNEMPQIEAGENIQMIITSPSSMSDNMINGYDEKPLAVLHSLENQGSILLHFEQSKGESKKWEYRNEVAVVGSIHLQKQEMLIEHKVEGFGICYQRSHSRQLIEGIAIKPSLINVLSAHGLVENVRELLTIKSDSETGYIEGLMALNNDASLETYSRPASAQRLIVILQALGFSVRTDNDVLHLELMSDDAVLKVSYGEITEPMPLDHKTGVPTKGGLLDQKVFGPIRNYECACGKYKGIRYLGITCEKCEVIVEDKKIRRERFGHITLAMPIINPFCKEEITRFHKNWDKFKKLKDGEQKKILGDEENFNGFIEKMMEASGVKMENIIYHLPILPAGMRPLIRHREDVWATSDLTGFYRTIIVRNSRIKRLIELKAPLMILKNEARMLQESITNLFFGQKDPQLKGLIQNLAESVDLLYTKKVSYAGKGIVVPCSTLPFVGCGVPIDIAFKLFEPHVCRLLLKDKGDEVGIRHIAHARRTITDRDPAAIDALKKVMDDVCVCITAHNQTRMYGFKPVLMEGEVIRLHPEAIEALALSLEKTRTVILHVPLLPKAQEEVAAILFSPTGKKYQTSQSSLESSLSITGKDLAEIVEGKRGGEFVLSEFDKVLLSFK